MSRLHRSRIKYTPGLWGTSCTFFCRSGLSFFDTATGCKGTRNLCVRHSERSAAESKNPVKLPEGSSAGSLDFARDDGVQKKNPREFFGGVFNLQTLSLRSRGGGGRFFFVSDHTRSLRLRQYNFADYNSVAHC